MSVGEQDSVRDHMLTISNIFSKNIEIHKFIPKSPDVFSTCAYEASFWLDLFYFLSAFIESRCVQMKFIPFKSELVSFWSLNLNFVL